MPIHIFPQFRTHIAVNFRPCFVVVCNRKLDFHLHTYKYIHFIYNYDVVIEFQLTHIISKTHALKIISYIFSK